MKTSKNMENKEKIIEELNKFISDCSRCVLCKTRKKAVPGSGTLKTPIMFIGEAPGEKEDEDGIPFVGRAGQLLTKIFQSVGLSRDEVYITNVVKCRPPMNRKPTQQEITECKTFLESQIALINPKVIVAVGAVAAETLLGQEALKNGIGKIRGKFFDWKGGIKVIVIFHPSYLLRSPSLAEGAPKWLTWQDMKLIKEEFEKFYIK